MAEAEAAKRPSWFWAVVVIAVLVLAAGAVSAPSVVECTSSRDGFQTCMANKLADLGIGARPETSVTQSDETSVATAQPAASATTPEATATVSAPDFGVRVEPDGSIVIVGSGMTGKTVQIFVNGKLYGTAEVDQGGDWVLVPDAPLPPGGYELTVVDPETGKPLDKAFVVAINEDKTSEPLVVASVPGKASEVLQGLGSQATAVASAESAGESATQEPAADASAAATAPAEPVAVATADQAQDAVKTINQDATAPADAEALASTPPVVAEPETQAAEAAEPAAATEVASAEPAAPAETVVDATDELQKRIDALGASTPPTIDAVEIDNGKNFFAGTGANGTVVRVYVDNVFVGDTNVENGHWLLETGDVLKNRSQRVRADQLLPGSAEVVARAEIDFIFEAPAAEPPATAVAEAPITVPTPDFGIDTEQPADVAAASDVAQQAQPAEPTSAESAPAETQVATAPTAAPEPDSGVDTSKPTDVPVVPSETETGTQDMSTAVATAEPAVSGASAEGAGTAASNTESGASTASGSGTSTAAASADTVPAPDFSIDTGIPVVVAETAPDAEASAASEPAEPAATQVASASEPAVSSEASPPVAEAQVPQMVASPIGAPELGRFATGKAIIRAGDNLWTIARRVYGSGMKYSQIYGANRDQIRDPDLIYPGQVFDLPKAETETASN